MYILIIARAIKKMPVNEIKYFIFERKISKIITNNCLSMKKNLKPKHC